MHRIFLLLASLLTPLAHAQEVYKVVGADGRITFTDRPPPASAARSVQPFHARSIARNSPGAPVRSREVEAALQVYHKQATVDLAREICRLLAGVHRYTPGTVAASDVAGEAAARWHERHADLVRQKSVVLYDQLTRDELLKANEDTSVESNRYTVRIRAASVGERITWCRELPKMLASPEFDLASKPELVRSIMEYKPVRQGLPPDARR